MLDWYDDYIVQTGRSAALWALISFLLTYFLTRWITRRIRARAARGSDHGDGDGDGAIKDVYIGGVHIHHQVWGILLVLAVGLLEFRFRPDAPWAEVLAVVFGAGAALALDEFALWLHLEDVYWTEEGRKSIDAVMLASVMGMALLVGTSPVGLDMDSARAEGLLSATIGVAFHLAYTILCLLKGKLATGLLGFPIPLLALVGAIRLAKPSSFWAKRWYSERKMIKAQRRFGARHDARRERLRDIFAGGRAEHPEV